MMKLYTLLIVFAVGLLTLPACKQIQKQDCRIYDGALHLGLWRRRCFLRSFAIVGRISRGVQDFQ